ncbi:hypothetical protein [Streptomyces sp. NPDC006863]|uniref:hypothetical protein n=1 Tax=Streptomyces sp. NPDC006863 TaxID=3154779 RepID=UPI0033D20EC6
MASANEIRQRMMEIQAAREEAVGPLLDVLGKRQDLQQQLAALDAPYGEAFVTAEAGGWTAGDLAALGAEEPAKRPKGKPRGRRAAAKKTSPEPASPPAAPAAVPQQDGSGDTNPVAVGSASG